MAVNNLNTPGVGIQPSLIDAKGDLLVGTANDAIDRLGVTGTTGAVLTADAGETTGLKWAAAGSVGGLVHIKQTTGSGVSAINVDDVFSADFVNYKILVNITASTTANALLRLRSGGSDLTDSDYNVQELRVSGTAEDGSRSSNQTSALLTGIRTTESLIDILISNPFVSKVKGFQSFCADYSGGTVTLPVMYQTFGNVNITNSYTGFSLLTSTGTISGVIDVYGYRLGS